MCDVQLLAEHLVLNSVSALAVTQLVAQMPQS